VKRAEPCFEQTHPWSTFNLSVYYKYQLAKKLFSKLILIIDSKLELGQGVSLLGVQTDADHTVRSAYTLPSITDPRLWVQFERTLPFHRFTNR
jgi:hypothetical protein